MNIEQITALVAKGESDALEFKASTGQLKPAFETLCAFLNKSGGTVLLGIKDDGRIVGQEVTDQTHLDIANMIAKIEPPTQIDIDTIAVEKNRYVIKLSVTPTPSSIPYVFSSKPFWRLGTSTRLMPQQHYKNLLLERINTTNPWDAEIASDYSIDDLNHNEIQRTISIAVNVGRLGNEALNDSIQVIVKKLELIKEDKLTNAAIVLFAKSMPARFSQCTIKMARFRGIDKLHGFLDSQIVRGNAFQIMEAANDFMIKHLSVASFFDKSKFERIDRPSVPMLAVREALCNAISHRDYSVYNADITLAIFNDRLELWNNGTLPSALKINDLKQPHSSYPRNKTIANVFYLRRYIEAWGTGTIRMIELCQENGLRDPIFAEYSGGFSVTFEFAEPIGLSVVAKPTAKDFRTRREQILTLLTTTPLSSTEIHQKLISPPSLRSIKADLTVLQKEGMVKQIGRGKNVLWEKVK